MVLEMYRRILRTNIRSTNDSSPRKIIIVTNTSSPPHPLQLGSSCGVEYGIYLNTVSFYMYLPTVTHDIIYTSYNYHYYVLGSTVFFRGAFLWLDGPRRL